MKTKLFTFLFAILSLSVFADGYKTGDVIEDFQLKNIDGSIISLKDYKEAKGFIVIFTCNTCPYSVAYEDRIIKLNNTYQPLGYPVIAINPNDPEIAKGDSFEAMKVRAADKDFNFPYLLDETQEVYRRFGAKRTPHVYLLNKENEALVLKYIGAIDDNYKDESKVSEKYVENAINAVMTGNSPDPDNTKAIGCTIKDKSK